MKKFHGFIKVVLLMVWLVVGCSKSSQPLVLTIEISEDRYTMGDNIFVKYTLQNVSDEDLLILGRLAMRNFEDDVIGGVVWFRVIAPSGQNSDMAWKFDSRYKNSDFVWLEPGETLTTEAEVSKWYQLLETGQYSIQAIYENQYVDPDNGETAWKGLVESNIVYFTIEPADAP
jgi:hypothetical protein